MRRNSRQLRVIVSSPAPSTIISATLSTSERESTKLTDTAGNPSESYYWAHMAALRREWQLEFWRPSVNEFEPPLDEIRSIETRVRMELYP